MPIMGPAITIMVQAIPAAKAAVSRAIDQRREKHLGPLRQAKCKTIACGCELIFQKFFEIFMHSSHFK
jgi:hypothetical protein